MKNYAPRGTVPGSLLFNAAPLAQNHAIDW